MLSGSVGIGGGGGIWSKPAALVCHICGREYGTTSLKIHVPQCEKMWIEREKLKDRKDRRPVPKAAASMPTKLNTKDPIAMAEYNEAATKQFNERALVACPNCGRTFFEDRLVIHLRSCRPGAEAARVGTGRIKSASEAVAAATPMKARGPGQTYGAGAAPNPISPPAAAASGLQKKMSPTAGGLKLRAAAPSAGAGYTDASPSARGKVQPVKQTGGNWEDDLNAELDEPAPPRKAYAIPQGGGADDGGDVDLATCSLCNRNFNVDRLAKHESICAKQHASDAKRQKRIAAKQAKLPEPGSQKSASTEAWKSKHSEFQNAIQYAKKLTAMQKAGVSLANLPPPPRSENADYEECPHCGRRFAPKAAERHIPACANTINKPKPVMKSTKPPAAGSMAAQRAKAAAPAAQRQAPMQQQYGGGGYGGNGGYGDDYGAPSARPASSGGLYPRPGSSSGLNPRSAAPTARAAPSRPSAVSPPARAGPPAATRQASSQMMRQPAPQQRGGGGGDQDLHSKISQLTATVEKLSKVVLSPQGKSCRSCGESNSSAAKFCNGCGTRC